jgi:hypothetical protein
MFDLFMEVRIIKCLWFAGWNSLESSVLIPNLSITFGLHGRFSPSVTAYLFLHFLMVVSRSLLDLVLHFLRVVSRSLLDLVLLVLRVVSKS